MRKLYQILFCLVLAGCSGAQSTIVPGIVPTSAKSQPEVKMQQNVIGEVEPIYLLPLKSSFASRIDTGASISSLDAENIKRFERDGKKWVSFVVRNRETGEKYTYEKPVLRNVVIKRIGKEERRPLVEMEVKMGGEKFKAEFTVAERDKFDYQTLVGRNILNGRAIVDVALANTLK